MGRMILGFALAATTAWSIPVDSAVATAPASDSGAVPSMAQTGAPDSGKAAISARAVDSIPAPAAPVPAAAVVPPKPVAPVAPAPVPVAPPPPPVPVVGSAERPGFGWGLGFRVLGATSDAIVHLTLRRGLEVELRAGWDRSSSSGGASRVASQYQLQDQYTVGGGDTATTQQVYFGERSTRDEVVQGDVAALVVLARPVAPSVDLLLGAGPIWKYERKSQSATVEGASADSLPVETSTRSSSRSEGWGGELLAGFRWWLVPSRVALVGEMSTTMDWARTRSRAQDASTTVTTYLVPSSFGYPQHRVVSSSHDTPSSTDDFEWKSSTCSLGLDVFF